MNKYNLYGASGHCKVIIDIIKKNGDYVEEIFDDNENLKNIMDFKIRNVKYLKKNKNKVIICIGNNYARKKIVKKNKSVTFGSIQHPNAIIDETVIIGKGTVVMAGVIINSSVKIGEHCIINTSSSIDHDCDIDNFVHVSPNATLCGNVKIGECTQVGAGSVIIQGLTIGKNVIIGAGAVVVKDVPDNVIIVGNPAKSIKNKNI